MKRKLVFWSVFNTWRRPSREKDRRVNISPDGVHETETPQWTIPRMKYFEEFCLKSILNQRYDDFLFFLLLDPKLRHLTDPLLPKTDERIVYLYDDNIGLDMVKRYDEIVYTMIDSDDMYASEAGEILMHPNRKEWMSFRFGYAYDYFNKNLVGYDSMSGPFFAHRFNPKEMTFFDRHKQHPRHPEVHKLYRPQQLPKNNFCVLIHDWNIKTHNQSGHILKNETPLDINILKNFGVTPSKGEK